MQRIISTQMSADRETQMSADVTEKHEYHESTNYIHPVRQQASNGAGNFNNLHN